MYRNIIALVLLCGILLGCAGCTKSGGEETKPTVVTEEVTQATEPTTEAVSTEATPTTEAPSEETTEITEPQLLLPLEQQVALMVANRAQWLNEDELYGFMYNFTMADMDRNGRYELYFGSCEGTGLYTFVDAWEVDAEGSALTLIEKDYAMEYSQSDMIREKARVYRDAQSGTYTYIFSDENRNGWAWQGSELRAWTLKDGHISEEALGSYNCETDESYETREYYLDAQGNEITVEDYEQLASVRFADRQTMEAQLLWQSIDIEELDTLTDDVLIDLLLQAAEGFTVA